MSDGRMKRKRKITSHKEPRPPRAQGAWTDLALHTLGWKAFQDLCAHVAEEVLRRPVEIFREAQDGGQDAVFMTRQGAKAKSKAQPATIQCKFSSIAQRALKKSDLKLEEEHIVALHAKGKAETYVPI